MRPALACLASAAATIALLAFAIRGVQAAFGAEPQVVLVFHACRGPVCEEVSEAMPPELCAMSAQAEVTRWLGEHQGLELRGRIECMAGDPL